MLYNYVFFRMVFAQNMLVKVTPLLILFWAGKNAASLYFSVFKQNTVFM